MIKAAAAAIAALLVAAPLACGAAQNTGAADPSREIAAFNKVNLTLVRAIAIAERYGGGKPIAVTFDDRGGKPAFDATVYHDGVLWQGRIDANNGQLLGQGRTRKAGFGKAETAFLANATMTLPQAVARAQQLATGKAVGARLEQSAGTLIYNVQIDKAGTIDSIRVSPMSGHADTSPFRSGVPLSKR